MPVRLSAVAPRDRSAVEDQQSPRNPSLLSFLLCREGLVMSAAPGAFVSENINCLLQAPIGRDLNVCRSHFDFSCLGKHTLVGLPHAKNRFRYDCGPMLNRWQENLFVLALSTVFYPLTKFSDDSHAKCPQLVRYFVDSIESACIFHK